MQILLNGKTLTEEAIELLEQFDDFQLCFSGGKDSITIYKLCKLAKRHFVAVYNRTGIDPPELVYFIRKNFPDVIWIKPEKTMWELIQQHKILPQRKRRFCCEHLKETTKHLSNILVTGITADESNKRKKRNQIETNFKYKDITYVHPIIYWKTTDVWDFIEENNLPFCSLYNEGFKRIGCILCPMLSKQMSLIQKDRYPKFYDAYYRSADRLIKAGYSDFKTPEAYMNWWLSRRKIDQNCSYSMFDE